MRRFASFLTGLTLCLILLISSSMLVYAQEAPNTPGTSGTPSTTSSPTPTPTQTPTSSTSTSNTTVETKRVEADGRQPFYTGTFSKGSEGQSFDSNVFTLQGITNTLLPRIANYIAGALAALAVVFLIYSGIQFLTAQGEPDEISKAGKSAFYVLIGLFLLMFSYAIVYLFLTLFSGGPGTSNVPAATPTTPQTQSGTSTNTSTGSASSSGTSATTPAPGTTTTPSVPARPTNTGLDSFPSPL